MTKYIAPGIQRRRRKLYAVKEIPTPLRPKLGRSRFVKSLETDSLAVAIRRRAVLNAEWEAEIEEAREGKPTDDAEFFRRALERARTPLERARVMNEIEIAADNLTSVTMTDADREADYRERQKIANEEATDFYRTATGQKVALADHVEAWLAQEDLSAKTIVNARKVLTDFAAQYPYVENVTKPRMQGHINELGQKLALDTVKKHLAFLRSFWRYLQRHQLAPEEEPFEKLMLPKRKKNGKDKRLPFTPDDLKKLMAKSEGALHNLIVLAAYTGCRIEELCALEIKDVAHDRMRIVSGKTEAAAREIPIHSAIQSLVAKLISESKEGYLLEGPGLTVNNLGQRSQGMTRKFSKLKALLGYDERYVFHSVRKSVSTMLEEAQVPEFIAARILGHALKTMSYGVYSGGVSLAVKREAMEKAIRY